MKILVFQKRTMTFEMWSRLSRNSESVLNTAYIINLNINYFTLMVFNLGTIDSLQKVN